MFLFSFGVLLEKKNNLEVLKAEYGLTVERIS
jgi:hypothetical protein